MKYQYQLQSHSCMSSRRWKRRPLVSFGMGAITVAALLTSLLGSSTLLAQESGTVGRKAVDEEGRIVSFQRDIAPIFVKHCYECHNEDEAKNDFRIDDPDSVFSYVEAGEVDSSSLFTDYLLSDDPDYLMPPPKQGGPLSPTELSLILIWIQEGADWPDDASVIPGSQAILDEVVESLPPQTLPERVWAFQGFLHPATVHFPIALFLFGAFFVVLSWKWPALGTQIPLACLLLGAPTAIAATAMGWSFASEQGYGSWAKVDFDSEAFWHRWSGMIVTVLSVVLAIIALVNLRKASRKLEATWKVGLLVLAGMVGAVGHQGGELSYGADFYPKAFRILLGTEGEATIQDEVLESPVASDEDTTSRRL